jgi:hypothetical protein
MVMLPQSTPHNKIHGIMTINNTHEGDGLTKASNIFGENQPLA